MLDLVITLRRHYPNFEELLNQIPDHRKRMTYQVAEIIMAGLSMFIFKRGSRNNADVGVRGNYEKNYVTLFGMRLPIMDTVDDFLSALPPKELDKLKQVLVQKLVEKKALSKWKFKGNYLIAIDATGIFSFDKEPFGGCPHKTSKSGKKSYQAYAIEAKIICANGLSISIASEWLCNSEDISEKQDCELKAFVRLAKKIKKLYPRLPITMLADGLYPNQTFFNICKTNDWDYILTFKEGTLKSVWKEVNSLSVLLQSQHHQERCIKSTKANRIQEESMFVNNVDYKGHKLNWLEYQRFKNDEFQERFVHITNLKISKEDAWDISGNGRMRWKIENEGFNTQKNSGYNLQHKYSRKQLGAMQNYYNLLQIAHMINQLTEKRQSVKQAIREAGTTLKAIWEDVLGSIQKEIFDADQVWVAVESCRQLRY